MNGATDFSAAGDPNPAVLLDDFARLQDQLVEVRGKVQALLRLGYCTPEAQHHFEPFFDGFAKGFDQLNDGLRGIGYYLLYSASEASSSAGSDLDSRLG
jgi:hypothetical protein